ncbi:hypothetical protein CA13_71900 [Planctomycetes bacterium CA13]|uniref:Uncharacterized protein n=1 Tax=Novipirellula herctigrandis TaxID=2527986 RepID=A0A5C5YPA6_9BACT|nr:hypothetical protein CA13_71900 [Planctomycetes bacterium CA13]
MFSQIRPLASFDQRSRLFLNVPLMLCLLFMPIVCGCGGHSSGVVEESAEYSYDEIMAQAAAEEAASEAQREK